MTEVTQPHPSVTICNTLWASALSFTTFTAGDKPLPFDRLFPAEQALVGTCREAGLDKEPLELCKLLLASNSFNSLGVLLREGLIPLTQPFPSGGQPTVAHLACALSVPPIIPTITQTLNGASNSNAVWLLKDGQGRIPEDVCFNQEMAKRIPHRPLFGRKKQAVAHQPRPLSTEDRERVFELAKNPDDFYTLIITLQVHQFDVNSERDNSGDLLIHTAVQGGVPSLPLLLALLNHFKADVNARDGNGMTPLGLACRLGHVRVAEVLICVCGADMRSRDPAQGPTPLHHAAMYGHPDVVRMLLNRGADPSAEDDSKSDAAFLARRAGHHECRQILSQHIRERIATLAQQATLGMLDGSRVYPSDVCQVAEEGTTLLILAARHGHAHLLSQLVRIENCPLDYQQLDVPDLLGTSMRLSASLKGLPQCQDHPRMTALHYAAQAGHLNCVKILLNAHAHPALTDSNGWLPLHHACDSEHVECVRTILQHPGNLGLTGLRPALDLARERGNSDIIALLQDAMVRRQKEIVTPALFDAAVCGTTNLLFTVLENGDDVNPLKEGSRDWPLLLAAGFGYLELVKHLYQFGGRVIRSHSKTGLTPLHVAARGGREDVVRYLLQFVEPAAAAVWDRGGEDGEEEGEREGGKNINCRNKSGASPMELAAAQGHSPIVQLLLDAGASCCLPDSTGRLLTCPAFGGTQFLLETHRRERIQTICAALEEPVTLEQFEKIWQGAWDYNLRAESGDTVLMVAAKSAPVEVVRFLLLSASSAPPGVLVAGGIPSPSPRRQRMNISPEESDHTTSDNHMSLTPTPPRKKLTDTWDSVRPASVAPISISHRRRDRANRFSFARGQHQPRSPVTKPKPHKSGTSGASNYVSSGDDDGGDGVPAECTTEPPAVPTNTGICTTIIRAINPHDGQTALHRVALAGQHGTVTLLLRADPECAVARDWNGDTALHIACRRSRNKSHRKTVEELLVSDKVVASVENSDRKLPEHDCPHTKTRKLVIKKRTKEKLDIPSPPSTAPRNLLRQISEGTTTQSTTPLSFSAFDEKLEALKQSYRDPSKSPTCSSDQNTSS